MPIISDDIRFLESTNGLGGTITGTEIVDATLNNLFDLVSSDGAVDGETNYRCLYVKNANTTLTLKNGLAFLFSNTASLSTEVAIGVGTSNVGGIEQSIPNENTSPIGVNFIEDLGSENGVDLGNITGTSHKAIWLRRIVNSGTTASSEDSAVIVVQGDTVA